MKSYFVWGFLMAFLALPSLSHAQPQNFQLILEGPFVVCENAPGKPNDTLTIWLPVLQDSHLPATMDDGIHTESIQFTDQNNLSRYPDSDDQVQITLSLTAASSTPSMTLHPGPRQPPVAYFYSEKGDCSKIRTDLQSFHMIVPIPDEVWAFAKTESSFKILKTDKTQVSDECPPNSNAGCAYATQLVLHYLGVDLSKTFGFKATCANQTCPFLQSGWDSGLFAESVGQELAVKLNVQPLPTDNAISHAEKAFRTASRLAGMDRELDFPGGNRNPILHQVCQIPPTFICSTRPNSGAAACPSN